MFIKILTPNYKGKIELTVRNLEALIEEAVEKAVREKCANCTRGWQNIPNITYLGNAPINTDEPKWDPYKVTCSGDPNATSDITISLEGKLTNNNNDNFDTMVNALCQEKFNNNKRGNLR